MRLGSRPTSVEHAKYEETYIPGWGKWEINKAHGLVRWPPLHFERYTCVTFPKSGKAYIIICGSRGLCLCTCPNPSSKFVFSNSRTAISMNIVQINVVTNNPALVNSLVI
uniref:Uncharacterized protein n=2 Tax=Opuntia streptacantha TaxID=393608 RepID=A0A7C9E7V9_OPUST